MSEQARQMAAREKLIQVLGLPRRSLAIAVEGYRQIASGKLTAESVEQFVKNKREEYAEVAGLDSGDDVLEAAVSRVRDYAAVS